MNENKYTTPIYIDKGEEIFMPITDIACPGIIPGAYSVSTRGRVYSNIDNCFIGTPNQYYRVSLRRIDNTCIDKLIHRLEMITFMYIPGFENLDVNHIDGNKLNNSIGNLEWTTHERNMYHAGRSGLMSKRRFTDEDVHKIIQLYIYDKMGVTSISEIYNCSPTVINDIIHGNTYKYISNLYSNIQIRPQKRITDEDKEKMCMLYNKGLNFIEIGDELGYDKSHVGRILRSISADPDNDFSINPLKRFNSDQIHFICKIFSDHKGEGFTIPYNIILKELNLEKNESNRKGINNIYNRKCYTKISSQYNY